MKTTGLLRETEKLAKLYPNLSRAQEDRLARKAANGDPEAIEKLIKHNLRRVLLFANIVAFGRKGKPVKEALSYYTGALTIDEAIEETMFGLWKAIRYFKPDKHSPVAGQKVKFSSWANFVIRQHLHSAAIKAQKRPRGIHMESWQQEKCIIGTTMPDCDLARRHLWEMIDSLSDEDKNALIRHQRSRALKKAIEHLKAKCSIDEWEKLRRVLMG